MVYLHFFMEELLRQISFCSILGKCVCVYVCVSGWGGWFFQVIHISNPFHSQHSFDVFKAGKKKKKRQNWILNLTWSWRSEQARGESWNKAWPWLHPTLFVPCTISVNSECCTVNTWMDFLEKAALASFSAHVHIYKYIYIYIW